jgi:hypothetical protein
MSSFVGERESTEGELLTSAGRPLEIPCVLLLQNSSADELSLNVRKTHGISCAPVLGALVQAFEASRVSALLGKKQHLIDRRTILQWRLQGLDSSSPFCLFSFGKPSGKPKIIIQRGGASIAAVRMLY